MLVSPAQWTPLHPGGGAEALSIPRETAGGAGHGDVGNKELASFGTGVRLETSFLPGQAKLCVSSQYNSTPFTCQLQSKPLHTHPFNIRLARILLVPAETLPELHAGV